MTPPKTPDCKQDASGVTDWLYVGKKVGHRDTLDRWRMRGEVIDVLPFGEFIVKWDEIKRPERVLRYDLRDV